MSANLAISDEERLCRLQLSQSDNVGPATYSQLVELYGSAIKAIEALPDLAAGAARGRSVRLYERSKAARDIENASRHGGQIITLGEATYPRLLAETSSPPPVLFAAGEISLLEKPSCGIVGSRNSSANGKRFTRDVARGLGEAGWTVVSGLARGY
jgi:DNA processing protein